MDEYIVEELRFDKALMAGIDLGKLFIVQIWEEDDACRAAGDRTRVMINEAWKRIVGQELKHMGEPAAIVDKDDFSIYFYEGSPWVRYAGYDGDAIFILVEVIPRRPPAG